MKLSTEQLNIVKNKNFGVHLIRGSAGSGKTTVGILKSLYLANNCCENKDKLLFITFNKLLSNLISDKIKKINKNSRLPIEVKNIDKIIFHCFKNTTESKKYKLEYNKDILLKHLKRAIAFMSNDLDPMLKLTINQEKAYFLLDEINYINANMYTEKEYLTVQRLGRGKQFDDIKSLKRNSEVRKKIYDLKELYIKCLKENGIIDFYEMSLISLKFLKTHKYKEYYQKFKHIIIDEFQDLNKIQIEFIKNMLMVDGHSTFTILCDISQIIYQYSYISHNSFKSIGINVQGRAKILSKNYRTTKQIAKAANCLVTTNNFVQNNELYVKVEDVVKNGPYPIKRIFENFTDEINYVSKTIKQLIQDGYKPNEIAITAKTNYMLDRISKYLGIENKIIDNDINKDIKKVNLITFHKIKGTEFKVVFIVSLNKNLMPGKNYNLLEEEQHINLEKMLLYVSMTRAKELLFITSSDTKYCDFIDEIDKNYLTFQYKSKLKSPYLINPDRYRFKNELYNQNNPEEYIRQWVIDQLIEQYGYKLFQISIEEPVQIFSKSGFVDIAIKLDGKIVLIVETKKYKTKITQTEISQLQSYMKASPTCMYGVLTNGKELKVYDSKFSEKKDIPTLKELNKEIDISPKSIKVIDFSSKLKLKKNNNYAKIKKETKEKNQNKLTTKQTLLKKLKQSSISQKIIEEKEGEKMQKRNIEDISYYIFTNIKDTVKSFVYLFEYKSNGTITYKKQRSDTELIDKENIKKVPILEYTPDNKTHFIPTDPLQKLPCIDQIADIENSMILQADNYIKDEEKIVDQEHTHYIIIKVGEPKDDSDVIAIIGADKNIHTKVWGSFKDSEESNQGNTELIGILIGTIEVF